MVKLPKNAQLWLPGYSHARLRSIWRRSDTIIDILFCIADHYEPDHGGSTSLQQDARVARWVREYPRLSEFRDADGFPPQHTFFTPLERYRPEILDALATLCARGFGEVEVHLHHGHDTSDNLRSQLTWFRKLLAERHGLLGRIDGRSPVYAFVHGNWALDNGGADPGSCGVNDEITVLRETGCYADLTMPAAPDPAQSRRVNSIYYAVDDPAKPRSYDRGTPVRSRRHAPADGLMMIEGPLMLNWRERTRGVFPRIENGTLDFRNHPTATRFRRWVDAGISILGRPEWVFVKVHSHGAKEGNADVLLGRAAHEFHQSILRDFNDGRKYRLHYVTARELYNIAKAAEAGESGNAGDYRDYVVSPPPLFGSSRSSSARASRTRSQYSSTPLNVG
jgi:hypothetical protein